MQLALNFPNPLAARQSLFLSTNGQPYTTSRAVAERFGKRHTHVLRAIEKLLEKCPNPTFTEPNFGLSEYLDSTGRALPEYRLTHDGFALLAMRFTGREALAWQIAFLQAFNAMEAELHARTARFATALDAVRPCLRPIVEATEAGGNRQTIGMSIGKSPAAITYHRRQARKLGLLITHKGPPQSLVSHVLNAADALHANGDQGAQAWPANTLGAAPLFADAAQADIAQVLNDQCPVPLTGEEAAP